MRIEEVCAKVADRLLRAFVLVLNLVLAQDLVVCVPYRWKKEIEHVYIKHSIFLLTRVHF